jgi:hypothetical protein
LIDNITEMTMLSIRKKLITYLADAEDSKVRALYTLLESEIQGKDAFALTEEQIQILDMERELHISGQSKSYTREEASQIIKGQRSF